MAFNLKTTHHRDTEYTEKNFVYLARRRRAKNMKFLCALCVSVVKNFVTLQ